MACQSFIILDYRIPETPSSSALIPRPITPPRAPFLPSYHQPPSTPPSRRATLVLFNRQGDHHAPQCDRFRLSSHHQPSQRATLHRPAHRIRQAAIITQRSPPWTHGPYRSPPHGRRGPIRTTLPSVRK